MQAFSVDEVADLLREKRFREDVVQLFVSNDIDGEALLLFEDDKNLQKLGVTLLGERLKLLKLIRDARIASNETTSASSSGTAAEAVSATIVLLLYLHLMMVKGQYGSMWTIPTH